MRFCARFAQDRSYSNKEQKDSEMKKKFLTLSMVMLAMMLAAGCSGDDASNEEQDPEVTPTEIQGEPKNYSVSGCKSRSTTRTDSPYGEERMEYQNAEKAGYLRVSHINALFNCEPGQILTDVSFQDGLFVVVEKEEQTVANCICPYDLSYDIGPLSEGREYTVSIRRGQLESSEVVKFNFTYSPTVKGQVIIKR